MKVTAVTWSDYTGAGGTSIAMYQLVEGLKRAGVDTKILCRKKTLDSDDSREIRYSSGLERGIRKVTSRLGLNDIHAVSSFNIPNERLFREADIIHLHSLHSGYFSYLALPKLTRLKPTVWTMHDVWSLTGHCGAFYDCQRWKTGCGKCPHPATYPPIRRDGTHWDWLLKRRAYRRSRMQLVVASRWFQDRVKESILSHLPCERIPWGLDVQKFRPLEKEFCRRVLGIAPEKKVILFVAIHLNAYGKGGDLLARALHQMPESLKKGSLLLTMGTPENEFVNDIGMPTLHLGWVDSLYLKAIAYSAADVFVSPTRAETFGLTLIESMACGTPVASFAVGPVPEVVRHRVNGYTAKPEDAADLAKGVEEILVDPAKREEWGRQGRAMVEADYRLEDQVKKYIALYRNMLNNHG